MLHVILLLAVGGVSAVGANTYFNNRVAADPNLMAPTVLGMDTRNFGIGLGLVGLALGGPLVAAAGVGLALGSFMNKQGVSFAKTGMAEVVQAARGALPGPVQTDVPSGRLILPASEPAPVQPALNNGFPGVLLGFFK